MSEKKRFNPCHTLYKPKKDGKGAASKWELKMGSEKPCMFLEISNQKEGTSAGPGQSSFDWENKQLMKLTIEDISSILTVLEGKLTCIGSDKDSYKGAGLFHKKSETENKILKIYQYPKNPKLFCLECSSKSGQKQKWAGHMILPHEAIALSVILRKAIWYIFTNTT